MRRFVVTAVACMVLLAWTDASFAQDEDFAYVDEQGEEVFGPDYMPSSPDDRGLQYWIGRPNAGVDVPENLLTLPQDSFRQDSFASAPAEGPEKRFLPGVPLRKDFDKVNSLREFRPEAPVKTVPFARRLPRSRSGEPPAVMRAHFVNVGQGDGAILEFPCQVAIIDVGGEYGRGPGKVDGGKLFVEYLERFFADRPHLNKTIDVVFLTHPHADHLNGVTRLLDANGDGPFTIKSVVDNGQTGSQGSLGKQTNFRNRARAEGAMYSAVELARQVTATGVTNAAIDPIACPDIDPIVTAIWGGANEAIATSDGYRNPNNHSVIVRVDFGDASFLFTGDLEDKGERDLLEQYESNLGLFDVDVYQVSHHGADDDTSDRMMEIMSPKIAVISMGDHRIRGNATAWDHGHPRIGTIKVLQEEPGIVSDFRETRTEFPAAPMQESDYELVAVERAIYGTGWEGTIVIEATSTGEYEIIPSSHD